MNVLRSLSILLIAVMAVVTSCESDYSFRGDASSIAFSADTLSFDTLIVGKASRTEHLMIYNVSGEDMTISTIYLAGHGSSDYHVNINGSDDECVSGVHLRSGDSLYVFVTVFPRFNADEVYSVTEDDIVVKAGNNTWTSKLWTCFVSAHALSGEISSDTTLTANVPYLIEDSLIVNSNATLTLDEGVEVYCLHGSRIDVRGRLVSCGSVEKPVKFRSSRLERFYSDVPGQWKGISLTQAGSSARMRHTEIAHSVCGISADSATSVELDAVFIRDARQNGLVAYGADVSLVNSVLANSGESLLSVSGGSARVVHSTLAGFFRWDSRFSPAVSISSGDNCPPLHSFLMANSVVVGNQSNELDMPDDIPSDICLFSHCYMRLGTKWHEDTDPRFDAVIVGKEPGFISRETNNYHLTGDSPLIGAASDDYLDIASSDADGLLRNVDGSVEIGAFEYVAEPVAQ